MNQEIFEQVDKTLVVLSGGMDSATVLAQAIQDGDSVIAVHFQYGSKHNTKELEAIKALVNHYHIPCQVIELPFISELFDSELLQGQGEVPEGHYAAENMKKTVVPFRNGILLAIAVGYAESHRCKKVLLGNHAGDHAIYPDCRGEFFRPFAQAAQEGTYARVQLQAPFMFTTKAAIAARGIIMQVPYEKTWSCYKGGNKHCGRCGTCVERIEAFQGHEDPTEYLDKEYALSILHSKED